MHRHTSPIHSLTHTHHTDASIYASTKSHANKTPNMAGGTISHHTRHHHVTHMDMDVGHCIHHKAGYWKVFIRHYQI